jgi:hypothetical protein
VIGKGVHHHYLTTSEVRAEHLLYVRLNDRRDGKALHRQARTYPLRRMLESSVVLGPQLHGPEHRVLSLLRAQAYSGEIQMFVPISPTYTSCLVSSFPTTITCQVALKNSLASAVPGVA